MIVCLCHKVSDRDIAREVASGCRDFDTLQEETRVATACGACTDCARDTFNKHVVHGCPGRRKDSRQVSLPTFAPA